MITNFFAFFFVKFVSIRVKKTSTLDRETTKDDKFLEVALAGKADVIVSGDKDLLVLHPFEGIPIVEPVIFLQMLNS